LTSIVEKLQIFSAKFQKMAKMAVIV